MKQKIRIAIVLLGIAVLMPALAACKAPAEQDLRNKLTRAGYVITTLDFNEAEVKESKFVSGFEARKSEEDKMTVAYFEDNESAEAFKKRVSSGTGCKRRGIMVAVGSKSALKYI